jgi:hypothetical protein
MSETKSMESARDLLSLWFKEEFAKGRCDAWERFFREDLRVTTATGEELSTLADWCAAYARSVNDRPLVGVTVTASFGEGPEKAALFWEAKGETGLPVQGAFLVECKAGRIEKLICFESAPDNEAPLEDDGALPDGNWWF